MVVYLLFAIFVAVVASCGSHHCHECEAKEATQRQRKSEEWARAHPKYIAWLNRRYGEQCHQCGDRVYHMPSFCGRCGAAFARN